MAAKQLSVAGKGRSGKGKEVRTHSKRAERSIQWLNLPPEMGERLDAMMFWKSEALRKAGQPDPSNQDLYDEVIADYLRSHPKGPDGPLFAATLDEPRRPVWLETAQLSKIREHAKRRNVPGTVFIRWVFIDYIERNVPQAWADFRIKVGEFALALVEAAPDLPARRINLPRKPLALGRR